MVNLGRGFVLNAPVYPRTVFGPDFDNRVWPRTDFSVAPKVRQRNKRKKTTGASKKLHYMFCPPYKESNISPGLKTSRNISCLTLKNVQQKHVAITACLIRLQQWAVTFLVFVFLFAPSALALQSAFAFGFGAHMFSRATHVRDLIVLAHWAISRDNRLGSWNQTAGPPHRQIITGSVSMGRAG